MKFENYGRKQKEMAHFVVLRVIPIKIMHMQDSVVSAYKRTYLSIAKRHFCLIAAYAAIIYLKSPANLRLPISQYLF